MFNGSLPRGSISAPVRGKTANSVGKSSGLGWNGSILHSTEQERRQATPSGGGRGFVGAPGLEEFQQLQARRILVPAALAADDLQQRIGGFLAVAHRVHGGGQVVARLVVRRV